MEFAAFIITYRRPLILKNTINLLFSQTITPHKILIIDNDPEESSKYLIESYSDKEITYFSVGINSGPAGGAFWGLKTLFDEGWEWVLWVDDDDAPSSSTQIETIFSILRSYPNPENVGMIGASGVLYNYNSCTINRIPDSQLNGILEVDMIAGNQFPIVHRRVYESGVLPDPNLFFGFEDLEFNLRVKKLGFSILVKGEEVERLRKNFNKYGKEKLRALKKNKNNLWREYYSIRTIMYILRNNKDNFAALKYSYKNIIKIIYNFRFGFNYGLINSYYIFKGVIDGYRRKMGLSVLPQKKYI